MKTIVVASGKGGVGKSMIASALAFSLSQKRKLAVIDADVDAPNLHLWLGGVKRWDKKRRVFLAEKAVVLKKECQECQKWQDICQFGALQVVRGKVLVNSLLCEGCGACEAVFPPGVIELQRVVNGEIRIKKFSRFSLISAQLYPGETGSGKLVDELKREAEKIKEKDSVLIDAPAGTGCPVIAALNGADFALLVSEPTPSAWADLKRVLAVVNHFRVSFGVVVNKWDLSPSLGKKMIAWAGEKFLGRISYDQRIFSALAKLKPLWQTELPVKEEVAEIFSSLLNRLSFKPIEQ